MVMWWFSKCCFIDKCDNVRMKYHNHRSWFYGLMTILLIELLYLLSFKKFVCVVVAKI